MRPPQGILLELLGKETLSAISFLHSWRCLETIWSRHRGSLLEEDAITKGDPMEREAENQMEGEGTRLMDTLMCIRDRDLTLNVTVRASGSSFN